MAIREYDSLAEQSYWHLINHWCYLGTASTLDDVQNIGSNSETSMQFDIDAYRILLRFLKNNLTNKPVVVKDFESLVAG